MATILRNPTVAVAASRTRPRSARIVASVDWELRHEGGHNVSLAPLWTALPHKCVVGSKPMNPRDVKLPVSCDVKLVIQGVDKDANHLEVMLEEGAVDLNGKQLQKNRPAQMKPGDLLVVDDMAFRVMRGTFAHA